MDLSGSSRCERDRTSVAHSLMARSMPLLNRGGLVISVTTRKPTQTC